MLENIIHGCVKANRESQKLLYKQYYSFAMGVCIRFAGSYMEAEEIVNDGFLKIFKNVANFKILNLHLEAGFAGWMKQIFIYTAIDRYRKNGKLQPEILNEETCFDLIDRGEVAINKMSYEEIITMVQDLSPAYRAVFNLYVIDGYKHEEIAKQLNVSVGTSKSNLAKARANIKKMLQQQNNKLYEERRAI
jgi:RNA polymerase sigma factor (sigma-70 family)